MQRRALPLQQSEVAVSVLRRSLALETDDSFVDLGQRGSRDIRVEPVQHDGEGGHALHQPVGGFLHLRWEQIELDLRQLGHHVADGGTISDRPAHGGPKGASEHLGRCTGDRSWQRRRVQSGRHCRAGSGQRRATRFAK